MIASIIIVGLALLAVVGTIILAIVFGGPGHPPALSSINEPFKQVDHSDLPESSSFVARDGTSLAYRSYAALGGSPRGSVVLIHGSSASGVSMHVMAKAFAAAGFTAYALDIRGHGESGIKGNISYVGQLEEDLEDFMLSVTPPQPTTLAGFSSGGGFVLRFAGSARQKLFSNYLLLSPFIGHDAPTYRRGSTWASVGVPRLIAISLLNTIGVHSFDRLSVIRFALDDEAKEFLTPEYSYALAAAFGPERDYRASIHALDSPVALLAGLEDELFYADRFAEVFRAGGKNVPVTLLTGIRHIPLTLEATAVQSAVAAVSSMNGLSK